MDVSKFLALLQFKSLNLARSDKLGDPFEGSVTEYNAIAADLIIQERENFPELSEFANMSESQIRSMYSQMSKSHKEVRKQIFINCWHENARESTAMWKIYSQSDEAVCIQTTYSKLANLLPDFVHMGLVEYIDYEKDVIPEGNLFTPFMRKRKSYEHEREVRLVAWVREGETRKGTPVQAFVRDGRVQIDVELDTLIECVYISPESPIWFKGVIEHVAQKYEFQAPVKQSELGATPLY